MNEIHPHWQATDGETVPVRSKTVPQIENAEEAKTVTISRKPAAIVGMLVVIVIGAIFFQGLDSIVTTGQVATTSQGSRQTVTITENGFIPATIEVEHGETIVWVNEDTASHSVVSETLCSNTGFCLQTAPLANGGEGTFTITPDIPAGTYSYASTTEPTMKGTIEIVTTAAANFADIIPPSDEQNAIPTNPNTVSNSGIPAGSIFDPAVNPFMNQQTAIPENPFASDTPWDGESTAALFDPAPTQAQIALQQNKPIKQPTTGAETWIVIFGSVVMLLWSIRGQLRATTIVRA